MALYRVPPPSRKLEPIRPYRFLTWDQTAAAAASNPVFQSTDSSSVSGKYQIGSVGFIPNLLMTTLAVVAVSLPAGKQLSDSAPPLKAAVYAEQQQNTLARGINPNPAATELSDSAPAPKNLYFVDPQNNRLPLISAVVSAPIIPDDTSQIQTKYQVLAEQPSGQPLTIRSIPNPVVLRLSDSAPPPKAAVYAEQQQNTLARGINPNPAARQLSDSAPPPKPPVVAQQQHNTLALGINPNPAVEQWFESAPAVKYRPQVDGTANLLATTLAPPSAVFPAGSQVSSSAPPLKSPVVALQQHNILAQGINPNPAAIQLSDSAPQAKKNYRVDQQHRALDFADQPIAVDSTPLSIVGQEITLTLSGVVEQSSGGWPISYLVKARAERARKLRLEIEEEEEREALAEKLEGVLIAEGSLTQDQADLIRLRGLVAQYRSDDLPNKARRAVAFAERAQSEFSLRLAMRELRKVQEEEEFAILLLMALA